jgi:hypothetical protein
MPQTSTGYLLSGQPSEFERLQLQSRVWEPAGRALLRELPCPPNAKALDVGCGVRGWLAILDEWVTPAGTVLGTDLDEKLLDGARELIRSESLRQVTVARDDLFASSVDPAAYDLVHARFLLAPLGRSAEQMAAHCRWLKPGGWLVLEEPDASSWRVSPGAPATERLIVAIQQAFAAAGGDFNAGRHLPSLMRRAGFAAHTRAQIVALDANHPYLRLPLQFAVSLRPRLETLLGPDMLSILLRDVESELQTPDVWGTTFTLIQSFGQLNVPGGSDGQG